MAVATAVALAEESGGLDTSLVVSARAVEATDSVTEYRRN